MIQKNKVSFPIPMREKINKKVGNENGRKNKKIKWKKGRERKWWALSCDLAVF